MYLDGLRKITKCLSV